MPAAPTDPDSEPKKYRLGVEFVADRQWKVWASLVLTVVITAGVVRLMDLLWHHLG